MVITEANVNSFLEKLAAQPKTHKAVATYECGKVHTFEARNLRSAENYAETILRPKLNRELIDRATGQTVKVIRIEVSAI